MARFHGITRFMIVDFNKGYWMVKKNTPQWHWTLVDFSGQGYQWDQLLLRMCFKGNSTLSS